MTDEQIRSLLEPGMEVRTKTDDFCRIHVLTDVGFTAESKIPGRPLQHWGYQAVAAIRHPAIRQLIPGCQVRLVPQDGFYSCAGRAPIWNNAMMQYAGEVLTVRRIYEPDPHTGLEACVELENVRGPFGHWLFNAKLLEELLLTDALFRSEEELPELDRTALDMLF